MASVPLKSVLKSESLFIDRSVEVKDRSTAHSQSDCSHIGHDGLWPVVGNLKVPIDLFYSVSLFIWYSTVIIQCC